MINPLKITILLLLSSCYAGYGQTPDVSNYTSLCSKGPIPSGLLTSAYKKYQEEFPSKTISDKRKLALKKKNFYLKSNYALNSILESGRVVFGDDITTYINKVADEVLKNYPDLRKELQFYALKSSSVNSICTSQGYIFVNVGLIAKMKSEAELAFVIAHEVAHYKDEHSLNSYFENIDLEKGKGQYRNLTFDDKIDAMFKNSRDTELKADSAGTVIYLSSSYSVTAPISSLDMLHYSYLPFEEVSFDKNFFNSDSFIVPSSLFLDSVKVISRVEDYNDTEHTHPNILKRKQKVNELLDGKDNSGKKLYVVSEAEFKHVKMLAQFEQVRLNLMGKSYGEAIYNSYVMLKHYPNNQFLRISIAKALYGLALYKNIEEFQKVAKSYIQVEGQSQQVHSMLKQMSKKQLNSLALSYTKRVLKDYPTDKVLKKMERQLREELVVKNKLALKDYKAYYQDKKQPVAKETAVSNGASNFFFAALSEEEVNSKEMATFFTKAKAKADSLQRIEDMPGKERDKFYKNNLKLAKKNGVNRKIDRIQIIDPFVVLYPMTKERDYAKSEEKESTLVNAVAIFAKDFQKPVSVLKSIDLKSSETDQYNRISIYKEMIDDIFYNDRKIDLLPLGIPVAQLETEKGSLISRVAVFSDSHETVLLNIMVDLDRLDIIYVKSGDISNSIKESSIVSEFQEGFQIFK